MGILGPKTQNLQQLKEAGFPVPDFLPVDPEHFSVDEIVKALPCAGYAVRSSALLEDTQSSSQAGQFLTLLDVKPEGLETAIRNVADHAQKKLGSLKEFSILIQEFIEPDEAGICFTRNPLGGREWVLESHTGRGDRVVGGELRPEQKKGYWPEGLQVFKKIEEFFGFPQDIEWCKQNGKLWILQARPITTISREEWEAVQRLEAALPSGTFLYEKTEISEIAPRPDAETFALLQKIYAQQGPVAQVYAKFGVNYTDTDFLRLVDGELYVDRDAELRSLLPAYRYVKGKPCWRQWKGTLSTLKNIWRLNRLRFDKADAHFEQLHKKLAKKELAPFLEDYQLIFEINLLSGFALGHLKQVLRRFPQFSLAELLQSGKDLPTLEFSGKGLLGNSLDLQEKAPFQAHLGEPHDPDWKGLSSLRRQVLEKHLKPALIYNRLRELARWLLVRHANVLRPASLRTQTQLPVLHPKRLSKHFEETKTLMECLSPGKGRGTLISLEELRAGKTGILVTTLLTPDLVQYFPQLRGILSEEGGLLSHLAIMAREHGVPVVAGMILKDFRLGEEVQLDARALKIEKACNK